MWFRRKKEQPTLPRDMDVHSQVVRSHPEVAPWVHRVAFAWMEHKLCGFAESCPRCWKPIQFQDVVDGVPHPLTGHDPCSCGTALLETKNHHLHGLTGIEPMFGRSGRGARGD